MADETVPLKDCSAALKRLRGNGENKLCFDCRASNPTWASVTYGVFLCIDCSAVHRSLGVHLTFIRSTQLDGKWTWLQLRHMQCGGNAKANAFFRQHNLTTTDAGVKYKSRVASMYRDKLATLAQKAMKEYGVSSLHIDTLAHAPTSPEQKEVDFFQDIESSFTPEPRTESPSMSTRNGKSQEENHHVDVGHLSTSPPKKDVRVSTIGGRKPPAKKKGLGAKKGGLGATRTKTNFSAIETEAQENDKMKELIDVTPSIEDTNNATNSPSTPDNIPLSSSLMYKSNSMKREEEKLRATDPKKAAQLERLGMGFGNRTNISHSMADSMKAVEQVNPDIVNKKSSGYFRSDSSNSSRDTFFDSFDRYGDSSASLTEEPPSYESRFCNKSSWGFEDIESNDKTFKSEREESYSSRSRSNRPASSSYSDSSFNSEDIQKKFGNAKGISSDQVFGTGQHAPSNGKLDQFTASSSISSADLFGEQKRDRRTVDYQNIKDSVSQVTGKLSNMASGVIGSLQTRYSGSGNY